MIVLPGWLLERAGPDALTQRLRRELGFGVVLGVGPALGDDSAMVYLLSRTSIFWQLNRVAVPRRIADLCDLTTGVRHRIVEALLSFAYCSLRIYGKKALQAAEHVCKLEKNYSE